MVRWNSFEYQYTRKPINSLTNSELKLKFIPYSYWSASCYGLTNIRSKLLLRIRFEIFHVPASYFQKKNSNGKQDFDCGHGLSMLHKLQCRITITWTLVRASVNNKNKITICSCFSNTYRGPLKICKLYPKSLIARPWYEITQTRVLIN